MSKKFDRFSDPAKQLESDLAVAVELLRRIKARVCGDALPNWENTPRTTHSRGIIADICEWEPVSKVKESPSDPD